MEKFVTLTAVAAPLPIDNCDTDQIMPKQFLRGIDKSGLAKGAFFNMRCHRDGSPKTDCVFNRPGFEKTAILCAGPNFGCGSSREHAVWGLLQMGIRAVIASGFGEIFYSNCFNNGLLACRVTPAASAEIMSELSDVTPVELTVDLVTQEIRLGDKVWSFDVGPRHREMLMEGLDMTGATLRDLDEIKRFRATHEATFPWMTGLPGKAKRRLEGR
ncbi:MAG: 3-isopropylmalate dehydratase small subunit [Sutterella wadsworthensis]|nr:3-isopropylmalate dehydratase small subunit [Sutterella wadsworthensis]